MRGSNGTDHLAQLRRHAARGDGFAIPAPASLLEWAVREIEDLRQAVDAASIPQIRVDPPHGARGPIGPLCEVCGRPRH
jgi:hypothetical protein